MLHWSIGSPERYVGRDSWQGSPPLILLQGNTFANCRYGWVEDFWQVSTGSSYTFFKPITLSILAHETVLVL